MDTIALVLDRQFGDKVLGLARQMPVWIVSSDANGPAIRKSRADLGAAADITELLPLGAEANVSTLERALYDIDQHHGDAVDDGYKKVIVFGAAAADIPADVMAELGFRAIHRCESGFTVER